MATPRQEVVVEQANPDQLLLKINGVEQHIDKRLDEFQKLLEKLQVQTFQSGDKIYNIQSINQASFDIVMDRMNPQVELPEDLRDNLITDENRWAKSLYQELLSQGVSVRNRPLDIFQHYGWLIEVFLRKINSTEGKKRNLTRLSFMTEAYQSSLRYLCYIQLAKAIPNQNTYLVNTIFGLNQEEYAAFDFLNLLIRSTSEIPQEESFMPELYSFGKELVNNTHDLKSIALFMEKHRSALIQGTLQEDENFDHLLDEYLTALVTWLRRIAFIARYRLVSIKDIKLRYRLGSEKRFVHYFGELHGMYDEMYTDEEDFEAVSVADLFTYNQSVLLFKGTDIGQSLENISVPGTYLSLTPLIIDHSVFDSASTQTPDICYYVGKNASNFYFAQAKSELNLEREANKRTNEVLDVRRQNNRQPLLNELYEQLEDVIRPLNTEKP